MFTDKEKKTANQLLKNEAFGDLLAKVFLETEDKLNSDLIQKKTNAELGEIVRADDLAEQKVRQRFGVLKNLAQEVGGKKPQKVPR